MHGIAKLSVALLVMTPLSCDSGPLVPLQEHPIMTDARVYEAEPVSPPGPFQQFRFTLVAQFQNLSDRTVYLHRCTPDSPHPIYGFRVVGAPDRQAGYSPVCAGVGHDRDFRLAPGAVRVDTLEIVGPYAWTSLGQGIGIIDGTFQLVYDVRYCPGDECFDQQAPDSLSVSQPFEVQLGR